MRACSMLSLFALVVACDSGGQGDPPTTRLSRAADGATMFTVESDAVFDGARPSLTIICAPGQPPGLLLDFVRAPATPPPPREVFAQLQAKGGPEVTVEIGHLGEGRWEVRLPRPDQPSTDSTDRENQRRLLPILYAFSRERQLFVTPPAAFAATGRLSWRAETLGPHLAAVQACAYTERPQI